jgi:hypothetical protein
MTRPCNVLGGLRKIVRNWKTAMWAGRALVGKAARSLVTQVVKMKIIDLKLPTLATKGCSIGSSIVRTSSGLQLSFRTPSTGLQFSTKWLPGDASQDEQQGRILLDWIRKRNT